MFAVMLHVGELHGRFVRGSKLLTESRGVTYLACHEGRREDARQLPESTIQYMYQMKAETVVDANERVSERGRVRATYVLVFHQFHKRWSLFSTCRNAARRSAAAAQHSAAQRSAAAITHVMGCMRRATGKQHRVSRLQSIYAQRAQVYY